MFVIFQINYKKEIVPPIEKPKEKTKHWEEIKGKIRVDPTLDL
jgi:hypothetical protein